MSERVSIILISCLILMGAVYFYAVIPPLISSPPSIQKTSSCVAGG